MTVPKATQDKLDDLQERLDALTLEHRDLKLERSQLTSTIGVLERQITALHDHRTVLQGDRDRLIATVEILARRLASPYADKDPVRGGWRGANQRIDVKDSERKDY